MAIISLDGLSLSGKSTMVQMLQERLEDSVVVKENHLDPLRPAISLINKNHKSGMHIFNAVKLASEEYDSFKHIFKDAIRYVDKFMHESDLDIDDQQFIKQPLMAYLFTQGRKIVNETVKDLSKDHDVILDRWAVTGWSYQGILPEYTWRAVRELGDKEEIWYPDLQVFMACPVDQIPLRRAYRQKEGIGTAGQMSGGIEDKILSNLLNIRNQISSEGILTHWVENMGRPVKNIDEQIAQATLTYVKLESKMREFNNSILGERRTPFKLSREFDSEDEAKGYFLNPGVMDRIYGGQIGNSYDSSKSI